MDPQHCRRLFILLCCVVLLARLAVWFVVKDDPRSFLENDSHKYVAPAQALLETGRFLKGPEDRTPETFRSPGFPLWLALIFSVFGDDLKFVALCQILLFIGTLFLTYRLGGKLFGARAGLLAVLLLSLDPPSFTYAFKVLTESLAAFSTLLFACAVAGYFRNSGKGFYPLAVGVSLGVATYVRPTSYYFLPVLAVAFAVFHVREKADWKSVVARTGVVVLVFAALVGSWQVRNFLAAGTPRFITHQGEVLYFTKVAHIISDREKLGVGEVRRRLKERLFETYPETKGLSDTELDRWLQEEALKIIFANPWISVKTHILRVFYFFFEPGSGSALFRAFNPGFQVQEFKWFAKWDYFRTTLREIPGFLVSMACGLFYLLAVYAFLLYGALHLSRTGAAGRDRWTHVTLLVFLVFVAGLSGFADGYSRYRVVVMPLLCVYSAAGLDWFLAARARAAARSFSQAGARF